MTPDKSDSKANLQNTKRVFLKKGTCSRTLFYILNREFGYPMEDEERAADPLVGGIMQNGYHCGLLLGSVLAVGAESFRRCNNIGQAIALAIIATQHLTESFIKRAKSVDCQDITEADFSGKLSIAKFLISGKFISCLKLAEKWAPEAIQSASAGLSQEQTDLPPLAISCASEVVKKMGASEKEMAIVAGFAGGLGLSGQACGALSAAIWMNTLAWGKEQDGKSSYPNPKATKTLEAFFGATDYEFLCHKISGKNFKTITDHTEFIRCGGCDKLINVLAQS